MGGFYERLGAVCFLLCMPAVCLALPSGYDWKQYGGKWYALTQDFGPWQSCEDEAIAIGAHLVNINSQAENDWLEETFDDAWEREHSGNNIAWVGYHQQEGIWVWAGGEPVTYTNHVGDWDLFTGHHAYLHCIHHIEHGTWGHNGVHDAVYEQNILGIIEIPEPTTLLLLALGGVAMLRRRMGKATGAAVGQKVKKGIP